LKNFSVEIKIDSMVFKLNLGFASADPRSRELHKELRRRLVSPWDGHE